MINRPHSKKTGVLTKRQSFTVAQCHEHKHVRALLCLGYWGKMDLIKNDDLNAAASLPDAKK